MAKKEYIWGSLSHFTRFLLSPTTTHFPTQSLLEEMRLMRAASEKTYAILAEGPADATRQQPVAELPMSDKIAPSSAAATAAAAAAAAAARLQLRPARLIYDNSVHSAAAISNVSAAAAAQQHLQQLSLLKLEHKLKEGSDTIEILNRDLQVNECASTASRHLVGREDGSLVTGRRVFGATFPGETC
jgi:hypothetical protein